MAASPSGFPPFPLSLQLSAKPMSPCPAGICGAFCFSCLGCQVAGDMDECCLCGPSVAMRTLYRTRYNIPVSNQPRGLPHWQQWLQAVCRGGGSGKEKGVPEGKSSSGELCGQPRRQGARDTSTSLL